MSTQLSTAEKKSFTALPPAPRQTIRRKCACGGSPGPTGECAACRRKRSGVQPKLAVNRPGDRYEQEADRVAARVMQISDQFTQGGGISLRPRNESGAQGKLRHTGLAQISTDTATQINQVTAQHGTPLPSPTRQFFESRFGHDFSQVRVHTDRQAHDSAKALNARAYTFGNNIVFGANQFRPNSRPGMRLLAHELTHVVQQPHAGPHPVIKRWSYGSGSHATGGGNTFRELTKDEKEGPNGVDKAMTIVEKLVTGTNATAKKCQKWYDDNCTVKRPLADLHRRAKIWAWRDADGASGWGLTDGSNGIHHAVTEKSLRMKSFWFLASVIIHEYWHDCDTAGDADIGNEAEKACGLPGHAF